MADIDHPFPLETGVVEVEDQADGMACDFEVVEHLAQLLVGDTVDDLGIHNDRSECNEIWHILTDLHSFI